MMPAMITCDPAMPQVLPGAGNCSPSKSEADMTLISMPGSAFHTVKV